MKNLLLTIAIVLSQVLAIAQCPQGDLIIFSSQAQIDDFPINYPNCTQIDGGVTITGGNIFNLNGLSGLTSIGGDLNFLYTVTLSNLIGLDGLISVGGDLSMIENYTLTSLIGLNNLETIGGDLGIHKNNLLSNLNGFNSLTSIEGGVIVSYNNTMANISGLNSLNSIGNMFEISYNMSLTSITGPENLSSIGGHVSIEHNELLTELTGLSELTAIGGELSIQSNYALTSLEGFLGLTTIEGNLIIRSNYALTSLLGLNNIGAGTIYDLTIYSNTSLSSCEVWSICNYLGNPNGSILISNNAEGCNSQQEVEDACEIVSVGELTQSNSLSVYPNPATSVINVETSIYSSHNTSLTLSTSSGQLLVQRQITEPVSMIDISHLKKGIYLIKLQSEKGVLTQKLVVN